MVKVEPTLRPLLAADVMTPSPRTCSPFSSVLEAVMIFRDANCGAVPVVDANEPVGVLTDRDVALALADHPNLAALAVSEIMTMGAFTVTPEATLDQIKAKFSEHQVHRLLVADAQGQLHGIIALADLAPYLSDHEVGKVVSAVTES